VPLLIHVITFSSPKIFSEYCGSLLINYNALLSNSHSIICEVVAYGRLKSKENFKLLALKVVAINYKRWSLTRGFKYRSDLETFGILEKLVGLGPSQNPQENLQANVWKVL